MTRRALASSRRSRVRTCLSTSRRSRPKASAAWPRTTRWSSRSRRVPRACRRRTSARSDRPPDRRSSGLGIPRARFFPGDYIGPMRALHFACSSLLLPVVLAAQAPPVYRGFSPGMAYRDFATRAQALARRDTLRCNTSKKTAQLMECGVQIRDPSDSTNFYLSAYVIEGKVAMLSFGDSGGARPQQGPGDGCVGVGVASCLRQEDQRFLERRPVHRAPERDLHAVHHVPILAGSGDGQVALLFPGDAAQRLHERPWRPVRQPVYHFFHEMRVAVE